MPGTAHVDQKVNTASNVISANTLPKDVESIPSQKFSRFGIVKWNVPPWWLVLPGNGVVSGSGPYCVLIDILKWNSSLTCVTHVTAVFVVYVPDVLIAPYQGTHLHHPLHVQFETNTCWVETLSTTRHDPLFASHGQIIHNCCQ